MNDETDNFEFMICHNCKHFGSNYCNLKKQKVTSEDSCIDYDLTSNPEHEVKNREQIQREIKLQNLRVDTVFENVKLFYEEQPFFYDKNGNFWFWSKDNFKYVLIDDVDLINSLEKHLSLNGHTVKSYLKTEYLESFKRIGRLNIPIEPPETWIQFRNHIINFETGERFKATPKYHFTNPIPHPIGETTKTPQIDRIFAEWAGQENVKLLKQIIAFSIVPEYFLHRIFFLVGSGSNGKGKYLEFLKRFIGSENTTSTSLELLINNRFETVKLYKKLVCLMGETNYQRIEKSDLLKRLSGQDTIGFEFKNKQPFDDVNKAKLIIATNSLPLTLDKTKGFFRRMMIIKFPNEFTEKKDILKEIPAAEYHNLARHCIDLIKELYDNRTFDQEGSIEDRRKIYEDLSDPLQKFLRETTAEDPNGFIYKYEFRDRFVSYLSENGYRVWSEKELGIRMKEKYEDAQKGEHSYRAWIGVKWSSDDNSQGSQGSQGVIPQRVYRSTKGVYPVNPVNHVSKIVLLDEKDDTPQNLTLDIGDSIIAKIKEKDSGTGVKLADLEQFFEKNSFEANIERLKQQGDIYEIKSGIIRLI